MSFYLEKNVILFARLHQEIEDAKEDKKAAKRIGQYRVSEMALYYADGTYIPFADMSDIKVEKMTVPTKGCCGIVLETPALTFRAGGAKRRVMTDSEKQTLRIYEMITGKPYETSIEEKELG